MSVFKEMLAKDRDIMLNADEFGELHDIDGREVVCVLDDIEIKEEPNATEYSVSKSSKILFAKCEDLPKRKGYGAELMVDGVPYMVQSWDADSGMAQINLSIAFNS